jgi:hypothetical protein
MVHKRAALFQRIAAPVSLLCLVANDMRERSFGHLAGEIRCIARPVPEARSESVHRGFDIHPAQKHFESHVRQRPPALQARKDERPGPDLGKPFDDRQRPPRKRDAMLARGLHAESRNRPNLALVEVEFLPRRVQNLARARRRQDQESQGHRSHAVIAAKTLHEGREVMIGHRGMMTACETRWPRQKHFKVASPSGRVRGAIVDMPGRPRRVEHCLDPAAKP